jgi:hypothetical protein
LIEKNIMLAILRLSLLTEESGDAKYSFFVIIFISILRDGINRSPFLLERKGVKEIAFLQPARRPSDAV